MQRHGSRPFGGDQTALAGHGDDGLDAVRCFADEVVIDFPSVAPAVDRMRRAFVAEDRGETHRAAIQLSPVEAIEGATVRLEVPVRRTCESCGGRGGTWTDACRACRGSGVELLGHQIRVLVPAGVLHGTRVSLTATSPRNASVAFVRIHGA